MSEIVDRAREEFFSEAQEIIDALSRDLLSLDVLVRNERHDPELLNEVFRSMHTLKGLSGLFGAATMSALSHELETMLDDLRLGRLEITAQVLDLLFKAIDLFGQILTASRGGTEEPIEGVRELLVQVAYLTKGDAKERQLAHFDIDPGLLGVLTEYEEHRLRTTVAQGFFLYRLRVRFRLSTLDAELDTLKNQARPFGEIITYLPTGDGSDIEAVELEVILASKDTFATLSNALGSLQVVVEEIRRRGDGGIPNATHISAISTSDALMAPPVSEHGMHEARTPVPPAPMETGLIPPAEEEAGERGQLTLRSVSQTVRVDIRRLDRLMNILGELAIVKSTLGKVAERLRASDVHSVASALDRVERSFERHLEQMQSGILEVRMVPLGQVFEKLARIVRQVSREYDKQVNLVITGAETEIDKLIVEELSDPLMHIIRNSVDHGIEDRDGRMRLGKPTVGTIALNAYQKGNHVVIKVEDDGAGMDPEVFRTAVIRKKMLSPDEAMLLSDKELFSYVFLPGFTTKETANALSGRGMGMDIVKSNIAKLGGVVDITSEVGIGTILTITLPITLAIIRVLILEVSGRVMCVPLASVEEVIVLEETLVRRIDGREVMTHRGASLPILRLAEAFGFTRTTEKKPGRSFVVVASVASRRTGIVVDHLVGQQDIVIKALGQTLRRVRGIAGATDLGDQRVGLVLDVAALVEDVVGERSPAPQPPMQGVA